MAIEIKDQAGNIQKAATPGVANTGLALGATALGLSILNGGAGLLNGGVLNGSNNVVNGECLVSKDQFYQSLIANLNTTHENNVNTERRFASLESAIATNAAVGECNRAAIQREFEVVDNRFAEEARYDELALRYALCGTIKGDVSIPFSKLTMGCLDKTHVIDTYEARPFREPHNNHGCGYGHTPYYGGF